MTERRKLDVAIFIDIESRDGGICRLICDKLNEINITAKCYKLKDEKNIYRTTNVKLAIINKPHFFLYYRLLQKFRGTKFIVLDTEGILPGQNRQHVLLEPEGYVHWFSHQANRYNFRYTNSVIVGYPRKPFLYRPSDQNGTPNIYTVATNFSILGYTMLEVKKRESDRKLKLVNDWSLAEYRKFQEQTLELLYQVLRENEDKQFIVKSHPNDPIDLWSNKPLPDNVKLFSEDSSINNLFSNNPEAHICLDGCTTILDAHILNIPIITIGRFVPFQGSYLRSLVTIENNENTVISFKKQFIKKFPYQPYDRMEGKIFQMELDSFNVDKIIDLVVLLLKQKSKLVIHDAPTKQHIMYWIKGIVKLVSPRRVRRTQRTKFSEKQKNK